MAKTLRTSLKKYAQLDMTFRLLELSRKLYLAA